MIVREDTKLDPEWIAAIHETDGQLAAREDCGRTSLFLVADDAGVRVVATTPNGRRAERTVAKPASLRAIAIGLVASIPSEPLERTSEHRASFRELPPSDVPPAEPTRKKPVSERAPRLVGALTVGARLGMPTRVLATELGLRGDILVDDWFLTADVRYAPVGFSLRRQAVRGYSYDETALALGAGRRFHAGSAVVDVAVAPAIVIMSESADLPLDVAAGTRSELRGDLLLRALFGSSRYKWAVTLDFEVAPFVLQAPLVADEAIPPLPTWTVGLGFGVAGDLL